MEPGSRDVARAAVMLSMSESREEEKQLHAQYIKHKIKTAAVDFGGEFIPSVSKLVERAVVAAKREDVIIDSHNMEGAVAGAAREALSQITNKAIGLNVGGKIGVARYEDHVVVAMFFGIGLLHLNEVCVSLGHRVI